MKTDPSIYGWLVPLGTRQQRSTTQPRQWLVRGEWNGRRFYRVFRDHAHACVVAGFYGFTPEPCDSL